MVWKGNTAQKVTTSTNQKNSWIYTKQSVWLVPFWATIVAIEIMDLTFSIDNVFGAGAFSDNILLIWMGVFHFLGILAITICGSRLCNADGKIPILETSAF